MNEDVKALRSELALLKLQFSERVGAVEKRLNNLIAKEEQQSDYLNPNFIQVEEQTTPYVQENLSDVVLPKIPAAKTEQSKLPENKWQAPIPTKPSFFALFFQTLLSSFFDWLSPVTNIYQSYKAKGMLGIFILTIVGIGLTLAGFGYLMQLLIDQLGAGAKSLLICCVAILVMGLGIVLKIKTRFGEFATAIVTLGVLLSYSTVYFSGSVYGLLPDIATLILYLAIALMCHTLALWLDTKVVAALGVIGIATMPLLSNAISVEPTYYLLSLAFVVCSSLILAYRLLGQWLAQLSLAFTLVTLEWVIGFENIAISVWMINIFYLLFFAYAVAVLLKSDTTTKQPLVFLATLVGATVLIFFQATDIFSTQINLSFALNTVATTIVSAFLYKVKRELMHFFILLSAVWGVLTIVSSISEAYWGISWAIEGILLLLIGRRYAISATVNQGQAIIAIALLYSWSALAMYFPLPALKSVDGWMLSIIIVATIAIWQRLINTTEVFNETSQHKIKPILQLLEVVWLSVLFITTADIWLDNWTGALAISLQIALLFRAKYCKQVSIEIFAAILIFVPLFYAYQGSLIVDSYRFTILPLFAKIAIISTFIQLWLWSAFYRKYHPNSPIKEIAEAARIFFYLLIPICWVGSVIRRFDEESLMVLWLSPLIALMLARKINHHLLIKEAKILTGLSSVVFAIAIGQLSLTNSLVATFGFSIFYATAYWFNRRNATDIYQFICSSGILTLGFAIPNIIAFQTSNITYSIIFAALYWSTIFNLVNVSEHLKRIEKFITLTCIALIVAAWSLMFSSASYIAVPAIFLFAALYQKEQRLLNTLLGKKLKLNYDLFLHSLAAISYVILFTSLAEYRLNLLIAPALAVHGALILFLKDKRLTTVKYSFGLMLLGIIKLAMIDAASALLWQKVVLFMGIGVFILIASFWYQKLVNNSETPNIESTLIKGQ